MHYYKFHIGDYRRRAANLSLLEHGIYRQLIDEYHLTEEPLTGDFDRLCWSVGARSEDERVAVQRILDFFFKKTKKGWQHDVCEEQVQEYKAKALKNKENGKKGGRPKNNPEKTQSVSKQNPKETLTNNHKPLTTNQEPKREVAVAPPAKGTALQNWPTYHSPEILPTDFFRYVDEHGCQALAMSEWPKFHDYWVAQPGQRGVKKDWLATWRNWLRKSKEFAANTDTKDSQGFIQRVTDDSWAKGL